jgi:hypothetical protein
MMSCDKHNYVVLCGVVCIVLVMTAPVLGLGTGVGAWLPVVRGVGGVCAAGFGACVRANASGVRGIGVDVSVDGVRMVGDTT